jgi:pyruvate-formate lyase-activating enzyme
MTQRVFPIKSDTACLLKWAWSTVYLGQGTSSSCHRTDQAPIPRDNFASFHNLPNKIEARQMMQRGEWPQGGCQYCEKIEKAGGMSDRQYQLHANHDQDRTPIELIQDPTTLEVVPTILEVYFNNVCNMSCLYCGSNFSSKWEEENKRFGIFEQGNVKFGHNTESNPDYERMLADFWHYLEEKNRYKHIRYYQILGGEPFYQKEFDQSLDFWESHPNPELTFNIITNLKVPHKKFCDYIDRFGRMIKKRGLKRLQITGSLDAWGPQEEYVRHGLDLREWEKNWEYLLDKPWAIMCVNAAITGLTIKTLPDLIERINMWNTKRPKWNLITFSFMTVMTPPQMVPAIFGSGVFDEDFKRILDAMAMESEWDKSAREHMMGIIQQIEAGPRNPGMIEELKIYLNEMDRRRGTDWRPLFPWLDQDWYTFKNY